MRIGIDLLKPPALFPNMTGRSVRLLVTLNGPFDTAAFAYRLTSPGVKFDDTGFVDVMAEGRTQLSPWPMKVPLHLRARAITGLGDEAAAILANARIDGFLTITPKLVRGEALQLRSAQLNGKVSLLIDLVTGRFEIMLSGGLKRYFIEGLGIVDVLTELKVVPGPDGKGSLVSKMGGDDWQRQLADTVSAAVQAGGYPDGIERLRALQAKLASASASKTLEIAFMTGVITRRSCPSL